MASTYKAYLGYGLGPLSWIQKFRIPHPGRVAGRVALNLTMPAVLEWVLGGNIEALNPTRVQRCLISDKPRAFHESDFPKFMRDDGALLQAANADWLLISEQQPQSTDLQIDCSAVQAKGIYITEDETIVGSSKECGLLVSDLHVTERHAKVWKAHKEFYIQDMASSHGTWLNEHKIVSGKPFKLKPGDVIEVGRHPSPEVFRVKPQHPSMRNDLLSGSKYGTLFVGKDTAGQEQEVKRRQQRQSLDEVQTALT